LGSSYAQDRQKAVHLHEKLDKGVLEYLTQDHLTQSDLAAALELAKKSDHLSSLQYVYSLELERLFKLRDKGQYRKLITEVMQLAQTNDEFQARLWAQMVKLYELERDVKYLGANVKKQQDAVGIYKSIGDELKFMQETVVLAKYNRILSELTSARTLLENIAQQVKASNNATLQIDYFSEIGLISFFEKTLDQAVSHFEQGLKIALNQPNNEDSLAVLYSHLAMTFSDIGRNDMAIDYFKKSNDNVIKSPNSSELRKAKSYGNLAIAFQRNRQYDEANEANRQSLEIKKKLGDRLGMAFTYSSMAAIYYQQGESESARKYYSQSLKLYDEVGYLQGVAEASIELAKVLIEERTRLNRANQLLERAEKIAIKAHFKSTQLNAYESLYELNKLNEDWKNASDYLEKYISLYKEVFDDSSRKSLEKMQALYESEKQTKRIFALEQEKKIATIELERQKYIRYSLITGVSLALIFVYFLYYRARQKDRFHRKMVRKNLELSVAYEKLDQVARFDSLTNIFNRRAMNEQFELELARSKRHKCPMSVILCDIDFFKKFNDTHGHDCGDFVLTQVAKLLKDNLREQDIISRWGGEEFLMLLPETDIDGAVVVAERAREQLNNSVFHFENEGEPLDITISMTFGCAVHDFKYTIAATIKNADKALYVGKEDGRNRVVASKSKS
jgi:diguanylate cyclase (GGDEF)-like protein